MQLTRFSATLAALLTIAGLMPPKLFSQHRLPLPPTKSQPQAEQIAAAIADLLKQRPLEPKSAPEEGEPESESAKDPDKPPADEAPINELIAYWRTHGNPNAANSQSKPSDKVRDRLLEACENRPWLLVGLTAVLPESSDAYDRIYKVLTEEGADRGAGMAESNWQPSARQWLKLHSSYFRDDLIEEARRLSQTNTMDISPINSLARLDWSAAQPLVEEMAGGGDPYRAARAQGILYEQAARGGDASQTDALRAQLKTMVLNRQSPVTVRQTAFQSLMATDWDGQADWYLSLFADPQLSGVGFLERKAGGNDRIETRSIRANTADQWTRMEEDGAGFNILWLPIQEDPSKWLPVAAQLVGNNDRTIHLAAVSCLAEFLAVDAGAKEQLQQAARALLPWLNDANWGGGLERWSYLGSLAKLDLPESIPGLIWILDNDEDPAERAVAAEALMRYRTPQAVPALRRALDREKDEQFRESLIATLAQTGGFADEEAAAAIEAYARRVITSEGQKEMAEIADGASDKSLPLPVSVGRVYDVRDEIELSEGLATKLFERAKALRPTEPAAARRILSIAERADLVVADLNLIERIGQGVVDLDAVKLALESRERMRKRAGGELFRLIKQGGYAGGLAAILLGQESNWNDLLKGNDANAQTSLLAAARYTRDKLPVELVGKRLAANPILAAAAESYLEVEDSAEARKIIWARHPGEARILGERVGAESSLGSEPITKWEEKVRKEVLSANGPEEIFAVVPNYNPEVYGSVLIRIRQGQAEISLHSSEGRRQTRPLTANELQELIAFTSREEVENLGPQSRRTFGELEPDRIRFQYLRLTRGGGRRIMLSAGLLPAPKKDPTLHEQLAGLFHQLSHTGEFRLRYEMEDRIPGLEVLLADDRRRIFTTCQEGGELRVLIEPERDGTLRIPAVLAEWRSFTSGRVGPMTDEPRSCHFYNSLLNLPDWLKESRNRSGLGLDWRSKVGDAWFASAMIDGESGIWKFEETKSPVKVASGTYINSIATPDGKWLVTKKTVQSADKFEMPITRVALHSDAPAGAQAPRELIINAPQLSGHYPIAFVAAHNKVLLGQGHYQYGRDFTGGTYYLLDPETGALQQVRGEFRPLQDQFARPLQPTGKPNEFWAAIYDQQKKATLVGRYDARAFTFTPLATLAEIRVGSPDIWVDAAAGKIYVTYLGHLLRVPLTR